MAKNNSKELSKKSNRIVKDHCSLHFSVARKPIIQEPQGTSTAVEANLKSFFHRLFVRFVVHLFVGLPVRLKPLQLPAEMRLFGIQLQALSHQLQRLVP